MSKYAVGSFEATSRSWQFICKNAVPRGLYIFVEEKLMDDEVWPKVGQYYLIHITRGSSTGRALHGEVLRPISAIRRRLIEKLATATWELDRHGRPGIVGQYVEIAEGRFEVLYDNGYRSNGADVDPCITFLAVIDESHDEAEALRLAANHLVCLDEAEIAKAKAAKRPDHVQAAPGLGELMAAKMAAAATGLDTRDRAIMADIKRDQGKP